MKKGLCGLLLFLSACSSIPSELPVVAEPKPVKGAALKASAKQQVVLNSDRVLNTLGEPTVKRREASAEVWVYSQPSCVLFIYMNEIVNNQVRVRHMEIGTPSFTSTNKESAACLKLASRLK